MQASKLRERERGQGGERERGREGGKKDECLGGGGRDTQREYRRDGERGGIVREREGLGGERQKLRSVLMWQRREW